MNPFTSRRALLGGAAAALASTPTLAAALPAPTGPIEPADYIAQRLALGDQLFALVVLGRPLGFVEYYAEGRWDARRALSGRANKSGADFHHRVAVELFGRGLIEDVTPPKAAARAARETTVHS